MYAGSRGILFAISCNKWRQARLRSGNNTQHDVFIFAAETLESVSSIAHIGVCSIFEAKTQVLEDTARDLLFADGQNGEYPRYTRSLSTELGSSCYPHGPKTLAQTTAVWCVARCQTFSWSSEEEAQGLTEGHHEVLWHYPFLMGKGRAGSLSLALHGQAWGTDIETRRA